MVLVKVVIGNLLSDVQKSIQRNEIRKEIKREVDHCSFTKISLLEQLRRQISEVTKGNQKSYFMFKEGTLNSIRTGPN